MKSIDKIAVVIPAYKREFFRETLESLSKQSNKNFTVYIGDDNSPHDLKSICEEYKDKLEIIYTRFYENLGGRNLVLQWNRCLKMINDENWVWLFSDDDTMDQHCVQYFYDEIESNNKVHDVYHFNINVIDSQSKVICSQREFPRVLTVEDFILKRSAGKIKSYVVEYVFNRKVIDALDGFVNFPLAWHSDEATVIYAASGTGIKTIAQGRVHWRLSEFNITPNAKNKDIVLQKSQASIDFALWLSEFMKSNQIHLSRRMSFYLIRRYCYELHLYRHIFSLKERTSYLKEYLKNLRISYLLPIARILIIKYKIFKKS